MKCLFLRLFHHEYCCKWKNFGPNNNRKKITIQIRWCVICLQFPSSSLLFTLNMVKAKAFKCMKCEGILWMINTKTVSPCWWLIAKKTLQRSNIYCVISRSATVKLKQFRWRSGMGLYLCQKKQLNNVILFSGMIDVSERSEC